jgi:hypothetical protein
MGEYEGNDDEVSQNSILDNDFLAESQGAQHHREGEQSYIGGGDSSHVMMHNNQSSILDAHHLVMGMDHDDGSPSQ